MVNSTVCEVCTGKIRTMAFQGTGVCGENCFKARKNQRADRRNTLYLDGKEYPAKSIEWTMAPIYITPEGMAALYGQRPPNGTAQLAQGSVETPGRVPAKGSRLQRFLRRT
jgi:hypothetical protein